MRIDLSLRTLACSHVCVREGDGRAKLLAFIFPLFRRPVVLVTTLCLLCFIPPPPLYPHPPFFSFRFVSSSSSFSFSSRKGHYPSCHLPPPSKTPTVLKNISIDHTSSLRKKEKRSVVCCCWCACLWVCCFFVCLSWGRGCLCVCVCVFTLYSITVPSPVGEKIRREDVFPVPPFVRPDK